jgi:hypothetical protein
MHFLKHAVMWATVFNVVNILVFFTLYLIYQDEFELMSIQKRKQTSIDFLLLSVTVQAGVGISGIIPVGDTGSLLIILQEIIMIWSNVLAFYISLPK